MNKLIKDALALTAITVVSGLFLGLVYGITKEPIAKQQEKTQMEAYQEVFPDAESFEDYIDAGDETMRSVLDENGFEAQEIDKMVKAIGADGSQLGFVVTVTTSEGYGGDIQFTMGVSEDGTLNGISILSIGETPGLGMKADTEEFKSQFVGKNAEVLRYTKTGAAADDEIDALSGATITTNAMTNGVNAGLCAFREAMKGGIE